MCFRLNVMALLTGAMMLTGTNLLPHAVIMAQESDPGGAPSTAPRVNSSDPAGDPVIAHSIAVLPLANIGSSPEDDWFAAGIYTVLLKELAKNNSISVIARTTMLGYAVSGEPLSRIASDLGASTIMRGGAEYNGEIVRLDLELVDPANGSVIWSRGYLDDVDGLSEFLGEIIEQIPTAVGGGPVPGDVARPAILPGRSPDSTEYYLRAVGQAPRVPTPELADEKIENLERTITADPGFAEAWAEKARVHWDLAEVDAALESVETSLSLEQDTGGAWLLRALAVSMYFERQAEARGYYERAIALEPGNTESLIEYALFLAAHGETDAAVATGKRALLLDPGNISLSGRLGLIYILVGDFESAITTFDQGISVNPFIGPPYLMLAAAQFAAGDLNASRSSLDQAVQRWPGAPVWALSLMAYLHGLLGQQDQARELLLQIDSVDQDPLDPERAYVPLAILGAGDLARALAELDKTIKGYVEGGLPAGLTATSAFGLNFLNDPVLEGSEFSEIRERLKPGR